jgi:desulfoferrodoxin (superoxide reductase-like protein)
MSEKAKCGVFLSTVVVLAILALVSLSPAVVSAHAPKKVLLAYNEATKTLSVTITHTNFSDGHYISKVEIKKNGKAVALQEYKGQPAETFTYTYKVDAVKGDTLEVKATCNKFGSTSETITVGKGTAKTPA